MASVKPIEPFRDAGFAGDDFTASRDQNGDVTGVWRLRFDRSDEAEQFLSNFSSTGGTAASLEDRDVVIVASTEAAFPDTVIDQITWTPAAATDWTPAGPAQNPLGSPRCSMSVTASWR